MVAVEGGAAPVLLVLMVGLLPFLAGLFWFWMLYDCVRYDPDWRTWIWILIFLNAPGALLYLLVRRIRRQTQSQGRSPSPLDRWSRRHEIWEAEAATLNVGNAYQFVTYGELLLETGQARKASAAFERALLMEPEDTRALWGAAQAALRQRADEPAAGYLRDLLDADQAYRSGDASLAYGRVLSRLGQLNQARSHYATHLERWTHPEAQVLYGDLLIRHGDAREAREHLTRVIAGLRAIPEFARRKSRVAYWMRKANSLLRKARAGAPPRY